MVMHFCPSRCLVMCTATILNVGPALTESLMDEPLDCPVSCVHACVAAARDLGGGGAGHHGGLVLGQGTYAEAFKDNFEVISVIASIIIALLGHWINRQREMESERRRLRLERLDCQLRDYFGPIAANLLSSKLAFNTLMRTWSRHTHGTLKETPAARYFRVLRKAEKMEHSTLEPEVEWVRDSWISFHTQIVGPIHKQTMNILTSKSHLYDGSYSTQMLQFIAHQIEYDLLMLRWGQGEYNMLINTVEFPQGFESTVAKEMARLREEQQDLIAGRDRDHDKDSAWAAAVETVSESTAGSVDAERRASMNARHNIELLSRASIKHNKNAHHVADSLLGHTAELRHLHSRDSEAHDLKHKIDEALGMEDGGDPHDPDYDRSTASSADGSAGGGDDAGREP